MEQVFFQQQNSIFDTRDGTKKIIVPIHTRFVLRNYKRKDGTYPLYLHITSQGERHRMALDLFIKKSEWNDRKQRARNSNRDLNLILDQVQANIAEIKIQYRLSQKMLTIDQFLEEFQSNFSRIDFLAFWETSLKEERSRIGHGTYRRYKGVLGKLKRYKKRILFSDFDYSQLQGIVKYLYDIGNSKNTVQSNLAAIKKYLNRAEKYGIHFPIDTKDIHVKEQIGNRKGLTAVQVKQLWNYFHSDYIPEEWRLILGYFLFSCFTGLRSGDIHALQRAAISNRFQITMRKNGKPITINLIEKAKELLQAEPRLFLDFLTPEYINRELKKIVKAVNIKTKVTFHVARHTFAINYLRQGGNVVYLQQLLGHADLKTTMIYVKLVDEEQNKDIHKLDNMF